MGKLTVVGWIVAIIFILLGFMGGVYVGVASIKGDFTPEQATLSYAVAREDLCTVDDALAWIDDTSILDHCDAFGHLFSSGFKCICELK